ncbi:MAG: protein kinase [Chitinivibrionales bacterium]|nr:protein kinase [Chitinivibrionales bacterium]
MADTAREMHSDSQHITSDSTGSAFDFEGPQPGTTLGSLRIQELIAAGGMAFIYKVKHTQLEVIRAVKMLNPAGIPGSSKRLKTEAKISANLHHPNIVQIFDVGMWRQTVPYIEMEYVEGRTLQQILDAHTRIPFIAAAAICEIVCRALEYSQKQSFRVYGREYRGLVHRDIKPANIMLSRRGEVKLADFGIALPGSVSIHTIGKDILGTYAYLSPEQVNNEQLDPRSDVYSLGCVLYEIISGSKAFPQNVMPALLKSKLDGKVTALRQLAADVPAPLARIAVKSMSVDKEKRYCSAEEFGEALRDFLTVHSGMPSEAIVTGYCAQRETVTVPAPVAAKPIFERLAKGAGIVLTLAAMTLVIWILVRIRERRFSGSSSENKPEMVVEQLGEKNRDMVSARPADRPRPQAKKNLPEARPLPSPHAVTVGLQAFTNGKFDRAISFLQEAEKMPLGSTKLRLVQIRLLESYINAGKWRMASDYLLANEAPDGYYNVLKSRVFIRQGNFDAASASLGKAGKLSTMIQTNLAEDIAFYRAAITHARFTKKPNSRNREEALVAWRQFNENYCVQPPARGHCASAQEKIGLLEN